MQPSLKNYADYLSMGLEIGACSIEDVVAWADQLIEKSDRPEIWMIELSTGRSKHIADVDHWLQSVPGTSDLELSFKLLMAHLGHYYPTIQPKQVRLLSKLYFWERVTHPDLYLPEQWRDCLYAIDCDLDGWESQNRDQKAWLVIEEDYKRLLSIGEEYQHLID